MIKNKLFYSFIFIFSLSSSALFAQNSSEIANKIEPQLNIDQVADVSRFYNIAVIQGLNKTTAKTSRLEMRVGEKINFGQITMIAHKCWQSSLDQKPESKILLEVFEQKEDAQKRIFYGWMFASSPSISGLEHPIYDLTAIACKNK
jgi:hypothetical protein